MSYKIHVKIPFDYSLGYGQDGIGLVTALLKAGVDVTVEPSHVKPPLPKHITDLFTKDIEGPFDVMIHHVDPNMLRLSEEDQEKAYSHVAWTMWEWETFGEDKAPLVRDAIAPYSKVLCYDDVSYKAFESTGTDTPLSIMQGGYEPDLWVDSNRFPLVKRDWFSDDFTFITAGTISPRKDPYVAIRALDRLWSEGYRFKYIIKTLVPGSVERGLMDLYPFLTIYEGRWNPELMRKLYDTAHCYLGPSWGEGKNLPALEAGSTGTALILSDVGGHRGWAMPQFATLVGGTKHVYDGTPSLRVDEEQLADACRELLDNRAKARSMGEAASQIIPASMSWDKVVADLMTTELLPGR